MSTLTPPIFDPAAVRGPRTNKANRELQDRLRSTQRNLIRNRIGVGIGCIFVSAATCIATIAALDWFFELSFASRAVSVLAVAAVLIAGIVISWTRGILTYTLSETAVEAEHRLAQFGQRLRTLLDYEKSARPPAVASAQLLDSLRIETSGLSEHTDWSAAIDRRPLRNVVLLACAVTLAWVAVLVLQPEARIAAGRALLLPLEYTTVSYSPQTVTVQPGESVNVTLSISGRSIPSAQLRFRPMASSAEWSILNFEPQAIDKNASHENEGIRQTASNRLSGQPSILLSELVKDTEFEVVAGPIPLPVGRIRVLEPLTLEKFEAHVVPPSYAGRPDEMASSLEFKVLEGSNVELNLEFNRPAAKVRMTRLEYGSGSRAANENAVSDEDLTSVEVPLVLQGNLVRGNLSDLRKNVSYRLSASTADGMSLDSQQIDIRVRPDLTPQVQFLEPTEELSVTATTEVPMVVEASDDLGLHKVGILFQIGSGPMQTLLEQTAEGSTDPFRLGTIMMLEEHRLTIQDAVTYYAFAEDNYLGQPRRITTPLRYIDIRPYKVEFQIVESEGGASNCNSVTLEELVARQRRILSVAFQSVQQPSASDSIKQLLEDQESLREASLEFSAGMIQRGAEVPSIDEAVTHMDTAIDALKSTDLKSALSADELALAALIRARENLRQILKQCNSPSCASQRKFDRELRQKLRMPKKKSTDQQEQLAKTRKSLDDIAKREREWSLEAKQCCSSGQNATRTPEEVAADQETLRSELAEIQQQLESLHAAGQAAREHAKHADESMANGSDQLKKGDGESAFADGNLAAERLEEISAHLGAMNARDFGKRLDEAHAAAEQLASQQQELEKGLPKLDPDGTQGLARSQEALATKTKMLAELLEGLERDAAGETGGVRQKLQQLRSENSPSEIANGMMQTVEELQAQRTDEAARGSAQSHQRLRELSHALGAARGEFAQPQLKELIALEEQLAQLQRQLQRARDNPEESATSRQKWEQLESRLDNLATSDSRLEKALRQMREGGQERSDESGEASSQPRASSFAESETQRMPEGFYSRVEWSDPSGLREVSKALQSKIQEAILAGALMDANQPVPSIYRELVEKYYRALSDDLR